MSKIRISTAVAASALGFAALGLAVTRASAEPQGCPAAATVDDSACFGTLASVTAKDYSITGTLIGGKAPITFFGQPPAYLKSTGYSGTPPDTVQQWDATIDRVNGLPAPGSSPDPNWYGDAKGKAFLPVQLNQLAAQFPANTLMVRFVPDTANPGSFQLLTIQPMG